MGRMARWHKKLQDYNFNIVHITGKSNSPSDTLLRMHQEDEDKITKLTPLISLVEVLLPPTTASFPLTLVTNYEQDSPTSNSRPITGLIDLTRDNYPAVSLMSAETILALDPMLNATIHATAYGLATTVCEQTAQYA